MSSESSITTSILENDILVLAVNGNLDGSSYLAFEQCVQEHLENGHKRVIIDCTSLGLVSSIGVGSLVTLKARLKKRGGDVKLAAVQGMAADVLRVLQLDKILSIYPDLEFARKAFDE